MARPAYPTLKEICDSHTWKREYEKYLPLSRFVFRPVGFLLTWIAIRIGLTTETAAWLSGFVGLLGYLCLLNSQSQLLPIGIGFLFFFNLLDCVDGSIARTMKTENPYGRFLDSLMAWIDMGFWALIGIMAFRHPILVYFSEPMGYGPVFWLAAGGLACYFFNLLGFVEGIFNQHIRDEWDSIRIQGNTDSRDRPRDEKTKQGFRRKAPPFSVIRVINHNLRVRETHYFLLVLVYWCKVVDILLAFFLVYYVINFILLLFIYCKRGRQIRDFLQRKSP